MSIRERMVSQFLDWRQSQENAIKSREEELVAQLLSAVPECLGRWLEEEGNDFFGGMLANGNSNGTLKFTDKEGYDELYDYDDFKEFRGRFENGLKIAWKGAIDVKVEAENEYKFIVTFTIV